MEVEILVTKEDATAVTQPYPSGLNYPVYLGVPAPTVSSHSFTITNNHASVYPISRTYAITYVAGVKEGPPTVFEQIGTNGSLFEGDFVSFSATLTPAEMIRYGITGIKLYRTIPGFDTSEQLGNPVETGFHFTGVAYFFAANSGGPPGGVITLNDNSDSSQIQGDLLISDQWIPPPSDLSNEPLYFGQTDGGWFVNARVNNSIFGGAVQISERFMSHAWPMQNTVLIPENITGMAIYYDNIFIGTVSNSYHISLSAGETETLDIHPRLYINNFGCVTNTLVPTNFGAMYAAKDGLVALLVDKDTVTSKSVASPGDAITFATTIGGVATTHFYDATRTGWWNGNFFGFINSGGNGYAYVFNQPSPSNNEFPLGQLVTIDVPSTNVIDTIATGSGFFGVWNNLVYKLPLPGYGYESAGKAFYTWKSKRYVMPGLTTFAGAKIVNDNSGALTVTINGYNDGGSNTPNFVYTRTLNHSQPFRIPHQHKCLEWEIILYGTSVVQEAHLATSYRDLTENTGGD